MAYMLLIMEKVGDREERCESEGRRGCCAGDETG
jgi:hypothetical protein